MGDYQERNGTDICAYGRAVAQGSFFVLLLMVLGGFAGASVGDCLAWAAACIITHQMIAPGVLGFFTLACIGLVAMLAIIGGVCWAWTEWRKKVQANRDASGYELPESAAKVWYRSFKEKTCVRVEFVDPDA